MRGRESRQDCVSFYQPGRSHEQLLAATQASFDFADCTLVVLMPTAHSGNHAAGVGEEACHEQLPSGGPLPHERPTSLFHSLGRELLDIRLRNRDQEVVPVFELHWKNPRLNLNAAVMPAHVQCHPWPKPRLATDLTRNDHSASSVDGRFHTIDHTTSHGNHRDASQNILHLEAVESQTLSSGAS